MTPMQQYAWLTAVPGLDYVEYREHYDLRDIFSSHMFSVGYNRGTWTLDPVSFNTSILGVPVEEIPRLLVSKCNVKGSLAEYLLMYRLEN